MKKKELLKIIKALPDDKDIILRCDGDIIIPERISSWQQIYSLDEDDNASSIIKVESAEYELEFIKA